MMDRCTKDQMREELRTILLAQAGAIGVAAGRDAAAAFIGFAPISDEYASQDGSDDPLAFYEQDPSRVDLTRFPISNLFDLAYDFAFQPNKASHHFEKGVDRILHFMTGVPRGVPLLLSGRITEGYLSPEGCCQTVADAAQARWKIEFAENFFEDASTITFTTRELALLANMSEGAVRNAIADKGDGGLTAIPGSKPVKVEFGEAKRWLAGRRGFVSLAEDPIEASSVAERPLGDVIFVPVAKDGSWFDPKTCRNQRGYTIGPKGAEIPVSEYRDALAQLARMPTPYWRRPNAAGNWGIVAGISWQRREISDLDQALSANAASTRP